MYGVHVCRNAPVRQEQLSLLHWFTWQLKYVIRSSVLFTGVNDTGHKVYNYSSYMCTCIHVQWNIHCTCTLIKKQHTCNTYNVHVHVHACALELTFTCTLIHPGMNGLCTCTCKTICVIHRLRSAFYKLCRSTELMEHVHFVYTLYAHVNWLQGYMYLS